MVYINGFNKTHVCIQDIQVHSPKMWLTHRFKDVLTHPHIGSLFSEYR